MTITRDQVAYFARFAGLDLAEEELDQLAPQLDEIITSLARVQEVPTEGIPPTSGALQLINALRSDRTEKPLDLRETSAQACDAQREFGVTRILAED